MKVLILAPQPFYQERGTPIAVDMLVRVLSERGDNVDLLTFHEGAEREYDNLQIYRIKPVPSIKNIQPGFSAKKFYGDIFLFFRFVSLMWKKKYDVVHAIEESAFMALLICPLRSTPFVYDMDSSMTTQLIDRLRFLRPFRGVLRFLESLPMRYAAAVVPMCDALADEARRHRARNIVVLKDISLIGQGEEIGVAPNLRQELGLTGKMVMYIGNLEKYQGIDLLLESFSIVIKENINASLIVVGGAAKDIDYYRALAERLAIGDCVQFLGPRPVGQIGQYMAQADILVSPRTQGLNTPMKIYSYLDSGVAVLATRLPTHTQVMNDGIAMLAEPEKEDFARAILKMLADDELRQRLARDARDHIQAEHSFSAFRVRVHELYSWLEKNGH